ncbi:hypothetical protein MMC27_008325, partial [Xylographa pallens]|nr:hypothetical protein [Xylographa pallens]
MERISVHVNKKPPSDYCHEEVLPAGSETEQASTEEEQPAIEWIVGWKLRLIVLGLCLSLFMVQMESSVTSTSILAITNDLGGFEQNAWIFTAYFFTYGGLLIIWSKLSDIFGRKPLLITAVAIFIVSSGVCGASQTIIQLIMFRWVQGIGGCGIYAIATLLFFELVPPVKFANYTALATAVVSLAMSMGPLIGGAINSNGGTGIWRWVFLI